MEMDANRPRHGATGSELLALVMRRMRDRPRSPAPASPLPGPAARLLAPGGPHVLRSHAFEREHLKIVHSARIPELRSRKIARRTRYRRGAVVARQAVELQSRERAGLHHAMRSRAGTRTPPRGWGCAGTPRRNKRNRSDSSGKLRQARLRRWRADGRWGCRAASRAPARSSHPRRPRRESRRNGGSWAASAVPARSRFRAPASRRAARAERAAAPIPVR